MMMKRLIKTLGLGFAFAAALSTLPVRADVIASDGDVPALMDAGGTVDNAAEFVVGVVADYERDFGNDDVQVGLSTGYNAFILTNGGSALTTGNGFLGFGLVSSNSALVDGAGSSWTMSGGLYVGASGGSNALTVSDGGAVSSGNGIIGDLGGANTAKVDGSGSSWTMSGDLTVGKFAGSNELTVSSGATVTSVNGTVGDESGSNAVTVSGSDSEWTMTGDLVVGNEGGGNTLTVSAGAVVSNALGTVGLSSDSNTVTVNAGVWNNSGDLSIGGGTGTTGNDNSVTVENGGTLTSVGGSLGAGGTGTGNSVTIDGAGSSWTNSGDLNVGDVSSGNTLTVSNGGVLISVNGTVGNEGGSSDATIVGSDSSWTLTGDLVVGAFAGNNGLSILAGAVVSSVNGVVGDEGGGNDVGLIGSGSRWTMSANLVVGNGGGSNGFSVLGGAMVSAANGSIGVQSGSSAVGVVGSDSRLTLSGDLAIGNDLVSENTFAISDGALAQVGGLTIGTGNFLRLDGGYFAWFGDQTSAVGSLLSAGSIEVWDEGSSAWTTATSSNLLYQYYSTDQSAASFSGYDGLGGYTVLGTIPAVPEPAAMGLAVSGALLGLTWLRRRRSVRS